VLKRRCATFALVFLVGGKRQGLQGGLDVHVPRRRVWLFLQQFDT
jgi:hypothetical protein